MTILKSEPANSDSTRLHWVRGLVVLVGGTVQENLGGLMPVPPLDAQVFLTRMIAGGTEGNLTASWDDGTARIQIDSDSATDTSTVSYILVW